MIATWTGKISGSKFVPNYSGSSPLKLMGRTGIYESRIWSCDGQLSDNMILLELEGWMSEEWFEFGNISDLGIKSYF